jgi:uncharacterized membrane protein YdbT with pleckstrin-like domain
MTDIPSWASLDDDEQILLRTHPSRWVYGKKIVGTTLAFLALLYLILTTPISSIKFGPISGAVFALLVGTIVATIPPLVAYIRWRTTLYLITTKNLWYKRGIYRRDSVDPIEVTEVRDQEWNQTILDRLLRKGDLNIMTMGTGEVDLTFADIPNPKNAYDILNQAKKEGRQHRAEEDRKRSQDDLQRVESPQH